VAAVDSPRVGDPIAAAEELGVGLSDDELVSDAQAAAPSDRAATKPEVRCRSRERRRRSGYGRAGVLAICMPRTVRKPSLRRTCPPTVLPYDI
jgi:hypothetical protein